MNKLKAMRPKNWVMLGAILMSISTLVTMLKLIMDYQTNIQHTAALSVNPQLIKTVMLSTIIGGILFSLVELLFVWLAFSKINKKNGRGWSIFLLVMGIFYLVGFVFDFVAFILSVSGVTTISGTGSTLYMIYGVIITLLIGLSFIMTYVTKHKELKNQK
jgi:hypothetical protein